MTSPAAPDSLKTGFAPVVDGATRILILGSLPGDASLAAGRYYGHPRNQFWRLMQGVTGLPLERLDYARRLEALRSAGVGLWDVIQSATRPGSLDARIRDHQVNPLAEFVAGLPRLRLVAFNGGKAAGLGRKLLGDTPNLALVDLPSSSPAHAIDYAVKQSAWREGLAGAIVD